MNLYSNIIFLTRNDIISVNKLAKLSGITQQTLNDNIKNGREFKGNQIYTIFKALKELKIINSLDQLFLEDLSKERSE